MDLNTEFTLCLLKERKEGRKEGRESGKEGGREGEREKGILTIFHVFGKVEESMNISKTDTDNKQKNLIKLLEKKNTTDEIKTT